MRRIKTISKLAYQNRRKTIRKTQNPLHKQLCGSGTTNAPKWVLTYNAATPKFIAWEWYAAVYVDVYVEEGYDCFAVIPRCSLRERAMQSWQMVNILYTYKEKNLSCCQILARYKLSTITVAKCQKMPAYVSTLAPGTLVCHLTIAYISTYMSKDEVREVGRILNVFINVDVYVIFCIVMLSRGTPRDEIGKK